MNGAQARKVTVLTIGTIFMVGIGKSLVIDHKFPSPKFFFASGFTAFGLSTVADLEPELVGPFCLLILTVVMLEDGVDLMKALQNIDNGDTGGARVTRSQIRRSATRTANRLVRAGAGQVR